MRRLEERERGKGRGKKIYGGRKREEWRREALGIPLRPDLT